jgi:hypothetical protein
MLPRNDFFHEWPASRNGCPRLPTYGTAPPGNARRLPYRPGLILQHIAAFGIVPAPNAGGENYFMVRNTILTLTLTLTATSFAAAQERSSRPPGAGPVEISVAPVGAMVFAQPKDSTEPKFGNYNLGAAVIGNVNKWIGVEGDAAFAVGRRQDLTLTSGPLVNEKTPNMLMYLGDILYSPIGSNRAFAPYIVGGAGALTMLNQTDVTSTLGLTTNQTYLATNVGAGAKWFATNHWGIRGDYRFVMIHGKSDAPTFFGQSDRVAHRVSGNLVLTY